MQTLHVRAACALTIVALCSGLAQAAPAAQMPSPPATTVGGSHQIVALQGCTNQWLFNGVWRVRVTGVSRVTEAASNLPGYAVHVEIKNGSSNTAQIMQTGVAGPGHLVLDDGNQLEASRAGAIVNWNSVQFRDLTASSGVTTSIEFYFPSQMQTMPKPVKWLWDIDPSKEWAGQPRYMTSGPSMRVNLTCDKAHPKT